MTLQTAPTAGDTEWFVNDRFGLFIHWGIYALPARHEWVKSYEKMSDDKYDVYFRHFDPDLYDPAAWADAAASAGMKYFVMTTKHHDGFCLWDSTLTEYKAVNTPYGKDILGPMVEAFRSRGLRTALYHSLLDWHHPYFPISDFHPQDNHETRAAQNLGRDVTRYAEYLHAQTRELLTQFGKVDMLWYDFSYDDMGHEQWQSEKLLKMIRELQPNIILNDRLDLDHGWDIKTREQIQVREWVRVNGQPVVWEACQTFSGSWGYHRDEETWKSVDMLVKMLIDTVSKGGNLVLNVGPTGRGEFDARALDRLKGIGDWMKRHSRSIYGCTQAPEGFRAPEDCRYTYNPATNRLYLHVFSWPFRHLHLPGLARRVEYAQLLNDASEIKMHEGMHSTLYGTDVAAENADALTLELPIKPPANAAVPVIELFLK